MDAILRRRAEGPDPTPDPLDELFDFLIEEGGSIPTIYAHHTEEDMNLALRQPWCSVGSDGSALAIEGPLRRGHPHPRNFGTFPRVLGVYVRERHLLTLEDAVRKMTSLNAAEARPARPGPAAGRGLRRRDRLRPGRGHRPVDLRGAVPVQRGDRVRWKKWPATTAATAAGEARLSCSSPPRTSPRAARRCRSPPPTPAPSPGRFRRTSGRRAPPASGRRRPGGSRSGSAGPPGTTREADQPTAQPAVPVHL